MTMFQNPFLDWLGSLGNGSMESGAQSPLQSLIASILDPQSRNASLPGPGGRPVIKPPVGLPYDMRSPDQGPHEQVTTQPVAGGNALPPQTPGGLPQAPPASAQNAGGGPGEPPARNNPGNPGGPPVNADGSMNNNPTSPRRPGGGGVGPQPGPGAMIRYPSNNPQFALQSALQDMGVNPFRGNPLLSMMMRSAPGLVAAGQMKGMGMSAGDLQRAGGEGAYMGDFLRQALGAGGGINSALATASDNMPAYLRSIMAMQDQINGGKGSYETLNPFAQYIMDIMNDPKGSAGLYGSLMAPFMSQGVGQAYAGGLQDVAGQALRRVGEEGSRGGYDFPNFFQYLFPNL